MNPHNLFNKCSKYDPYCLFGKLRIKYLNDKPHFPEKIKLILSQIQINTLFKKYDKKWKGMWYKCIHKDMIFPVDIHQTNTKFSVTF